MTKRDKGKVLLIPLSDTDYNSLSQQCPAKISARWLVAASVMPPGCSGSGDGGWMCLCVYLIEVSTNLREVEQCESSVTLGCLSTKISKAAFGSDFCGQLSQFLIYRVSQNYGRTEIISEGH